LPSLSSQQPALEKNSDEALLKALKEEGVEPPGGKAPGNATLPSTVKAAKSGTYVIQVGSHPTRSEADAQVRQLKGRGVSPDVLPPFKDKQGEWHRVIVGSFKSKREADREAAQLKAKGVIISFFVWRLP
jgi:cell division protein FtsN